MSASANRPPALTTLQAGRGLAALLVVLFHATGLVASKNYWNSEILYGLFGFGHAGVEFFFALSGFIMILIHRGDIGQPARLARFAKKRAVRIYPIYWFITLCVAALYYIMSDSRLGLFPNSLLLIGINNEAMLAVSWTLFHEILFYIIFAVLIFNRRYGTVFFAIWFAACAIWIGRPVPHYSVSSVNIVFGFGMLAGLAFKHVPSPVQILCVAGAAFAALGIEEVYFGLLSGDVRALLYGGASAIGIAAAVCAERTGAIASPKWMTTLGNSSYSLYLVHYPVLAAASQLWLATPLRSLPPAFAFCAIVAAAITAGYMTHWLVERRIMAVLGKNPSGFAAART